MKLQLQLHPQDFAIPAELSSTTYPSPTPSGSIGPRSSSSDDSSSGITGGITGGTTGSTTAVDSSPKIPSTPGPNPTANSGDLLSRAVQGAHHTIDRLADTAAPHVQKLQDGMSSAGETISERADQALVTGEDWAQSVRATVRENPLAAVVAAVAVGMLIARVTR